MNQLPEIEQQNFLLSKVVSQSFRFSIGRCILVVRLLLLFTPTCVHAQAAKNQPKSASPPVIDLDDCRELLLSGKYKASLDMSTRAVEKRVYGEDWYLLKARAELILGEYAAAVETVEGGVKRYSWSIQLRELGRTAYLHTDNDARATQMVLEIDRQVAATPWRYTDPEDLTSLGRIALLVQADAKQVLESFFDRAKQSGRKRRDPWLASGHLALSKGDSKLAADTFKAGLKHFPDDPDLSFGLARAIGSSDGQQASALLKAALEKNPQHIPSMLFQVDRMIDSEQYRPAEAIIAKVLTINRRHPEAWAYRAVLAHLENNEAGELSARKQALSTWKKNPQVDHLIGEKLSQKYRFAEGAAYQRRALESDPDFVAAKIQLSQDLLRLAEDEDGWKMADAAHKADGYDTTIFNLLTLRDKLEKFETLEDDHFIVRMSKREAGIYGARVQSLLNEARTVLTKKYGLELTDKVTVEIFPEENDFAVRTFGMPAVSGFLGVCFGKVITANSPASQLENPSNWESVLWHEFCHVVTLQLTKNKMPRWLSEGISVYEESQRNPVWGQRMTPEFVALIKEGELTPVAELSSAFLSPASGMHLQFAYYESSLVVEYIIREFGAEAIRKTLVDLGQGMNINDALERNTNGIEPLQAGFEKFVAERVATMAPGADLSVPEDNLKVTEKAQWMADHPTSLTALMIRAQLHMRQKQWDKAIEPLETHYRLFPNDGSGTALSGLATAYRELGNVPAEKDALMKLMRVSSDSLGAFRRLLKLQVEESEWEAALDTGNRILAVNPLIKETHRQLARAAEAVDQSDAAISAYQTLLFLDPEDPAGINFKLARLLHEAGDPAAKRHVLLALEEAPRYREAHQLLLKIVRSPTTKQKTPRSTQRTKSGGLPVTTVSRTRVVEERDDIADANPPSLPVDLPKQNSSAATIESASDVDPVAPALPVDFSPDTKSAAAGTDAALSPPPPASPVTFQGAGQ